ncbi:MAG: germination protein Ger(x)C family [Sporomusa sp.]|nr:germination protein Ger(x)C family [Sporomusa sp.]
MTYRRIITCLLLICFCGTTSGCWDRRELQDRGFVMATAIDLAEEGQGEGGRLENFTQATGPKPLRLSVQILKLTPSGDSEGGKSEGKTFVLSNTGRSIHEMIRDMLGQTSKGLYFEHIQAILISEAVAKEYDLNQITDFWRRDAEMRWRTRLFIVKGTAREILEFQPPTGEPGGVFLANLGRHAARSPHIASLKTDLGFTSQVLDAGGDTALPCLEMEKKQLKVNAIALFKKGKFIGYADEYTTKGIRLIRGNIKSAVFTFNCPKHPDHTVTFELFRHNTIITPHVDGDLIYFTLNMAARGNISEVNCNQFHDTADIEFLEETKKQVAEEIKNNISHSINLMQQRGIDMAYFGGYLKAYEPETWARVKDDWEDVFPTIPLYVNVRVAIHNVGEHK